MLVTGRGSIAQVQYSGEEASAEIKKLLDSVIENEDDFERWEALVVRASELEGGVTRNSSPSAIELLRNVFDCFLGKFPLFFGYWRKYADLEFSIGGTETAEMVYERGVSCIPISVDLWTHYCSFKVDTCHDNDVIRDLFERGAQFVSLDFQGHPFWDKYIEFEERVQEPSNVTKILARVVAFPQYKFAGYYERFRPLVATRPLEELADKELLAQVTEAVQQENQGYEKAPLEIERQLRERLDIHYYEVYTSVQAQVTDRWKYEKEVKRAYFHVTEVEDAEINNWREYLDHEEKEGDFYRTAYLYERCLVACALYEEFWLRYARWMLAQGKEEDARLIYVRASCIYVPIHRSTIRLNWSRLEEKLGRPNVARDIHLAILEETPDDVETIISLAGIERRHEGNDAAVRLLENFINQRSASVGGYLAAEQARILWQCKGAIDETSQLFSDKHEKFLDSRAFWHKCLEFAIHQPATNQDDAHARVKQVHDQLRAKGRFSRQDSEALSHYYMQYLLEHGGKDAADEYMQLDKEVNGYVSAATVPSPAPNPRKPHSGKSRKRGAGRSPR